MVSLDSDTDSPFQCLDLPLSLVREGIFVSWKVVLWVILDVNPLNRFGIMPTWLVLLQIKLHITIMLIMRTSYEGNIVSL